VHRLTQTFAAKLARRRQLRAVPVGEASGRYQHTISLHEEDSRLAQHVLWDDPAQPTSLDRRRQPCHQDRFWFVARRAVSRSCRFVSPRLPEQKSRQMLPDS
jgi:hypothetical protein